jgi:hypothetical protein
MLHLVSQAIEANLALSFEIVIAEGVFVHDNYLERLSAMYNVECERLVPHWGQSALLVVSFNPLVLNLQDYIWV